jgi:hypothetical protein
MAAQTKNLVFGGTAFPGCAEKLHRPESLCHRMLRGAQVDKLFFHQAGGIAL